MNGSKKMLNTEKTPKTMLGKYKYRSREESRQTAKTAHFEIFFKNGNYLTNFGEILEIIPRPEYDHLPLI